ncbi:MAG: aldo/keto reductase [Roseiflexus sp.]|nr:aldo/keto reductase [Roseiflexus sp.]
MQYRRLGRTGLRVSAVALGTVEIGLDYGIPSGDHRLPSAAQATALLHRALDLGVNLIDTAPAYGESERRIGAALAGRRSEYLIATKIANPPDDLCGDRLRAWVEALLAASLRALRTDRIDLLQIHSAAPETIRRGELTAILVKLRDAGFVRAIGATTYGVEAARAALDDGRYDALQVAYSPLDRRLEHGVLPALRDGGVGVIVRSVLLKGALTQRAEHLPEALSELRRAVGRLADIAAKAQLTLPALAYRYVLAHPAVSTALVGTSRIEELEEICQQAEAGGLPPEVRDAVRTVRLDDDRLLDPSQWPML